MGDPIVGGTVGSIAGVTVEWGIVVGGAVPGDGAVCPSTTAFLRSFK